MKPAETDLIACDLKTHANCRRQKPKGSIQSDYDFDESCATDIETISASRLPAVKANFLEGGVH